MFKVHSSSTLMVRYLSSILIICFGSLLLATHQASAKMKTVKYRSPLEVQIKLTKGSYQVGEPIDGEVVIKNTYSASLPAVFTIKLFFKDQLFSEQTTAIKRVPMGTVEFTFKGFGIPDFNHHTGAEGEWKIHIVQMNMDEHYAKEVKVLIVPLAVHKVLDKKSRIKQ